MNDFKKLFKNKKILIGMVHLGPLLGVCDHPSLDIIIKNALYDANILKKAGYDAILVENNYDLPHQEFVDSSVVAAYGACIAEIKKEVDVPLGVCVLWNDYKTALSLAKIYKLDFVRIPVFVDHVRTDFGEINACFADLANFRKNIDEKETLLFTDIQVKHSELLNIRPIGESAQEAIKEGSNALVVTGKWTGNAPNIEKIKEVRQVSGDFPIIIGSGTDENNITQMLDLVDGFIIGTSIKEGDPVDKSVNRNLKPYSFRIDPQKAKNLRKKMLSAYQIGKDTLSI